MEENSNVVTLFDNQGSSIDKLLDNVKQQDLSVCLFFGKDDEGNIYCGFSDLESRTHLMGLLSYLQMYLYELKD